MECRSIRDCILELSDFRGEGEKMRKKILALFLCAAMFLSGSSLVWAASAQDSEVETTSGNAVDEEEEKSETGTVVPTPTPEAEPKETGTPVPTMPANSLVPESPDTEEAYIDAYSEDALVAEYRAHVSKIGWQDYVTDGATAGTTGQKLPMEAFEVSVNGVDGLGVEYRAYVSGQGWQGYAADGAVAGTTGQKLSIEAVQISLTGDNKDQYDIYYRVHVDKLGWLDWAENGQEAGTLGYGYGMQAIEIKVLPEGSQAPGETETPFQSVLSVTAQAHVSKKGWMTPVSGNKIQIGTTGQSLNMEAFKLDTNQLYGIGIEYSAHVSKVGWKNYVSDGATAGTTGQKLAVEALKIRLTGDEANRYDVYYRVHVAKLGWLGWTSNGEVAGTTGVSYGIQAVEIQIVPKGSGAPGNTANAYVSPEVQYRAHVSKKGWMSPVANGAMAGTTGQKLPMEALEVSVSGMENLGIQYKAHVSKIGWQDYVANGAEAGTTGQKLGIEAVQISLTGSAAQYFDVWYRVHSDKVGWLGWTKNGAIAGTTGYKYSAQAIQIVIKGKGAAAPGSTANPYLKNQEGWTYINGYRRYKDRNGNILNDVSSIFNPSSKYITVDRIRGITTIYGYNSATGSYDTPIKAMICSVGNPISFTAPGTYRIGWQLTYKKMTGEGYECWAPYVSQIYGAVYFHGVASVSPDLQSVSAGAFNALGTPQSLGCVRLAACDAKWIYYNVNSGTTVKIGDNLAAPMTGIRYAWRGGELGPDPTYS